MSIGYFVDVQGTLLSDEDKSPIKGAVEFISFLNENNIPYIVITNNTKEMSIDFLHSLHVKGFNISKEKFLDPFMVLESKVKDKDICAFGPKAFINVLKNLGYNISKESAKNILIASHDNFTFDDFASMIELSQKGLHVKGMHGTSIYSKNGRKYPGVGAILEMIKFATGTKYDVIGKPSPSFYEEAFNKIKMQNADLDYKDITMISDDAIGDLVGAKKMDINTCLVLSGKCEKIDDVVHVKSSLDVVYKDIGLILEELV